MKLLLDTHVWLWRLLEPERLSRKANDTLSAHGHTVYLSPISVWETLVLARRGRLALNPGPIEWIRPALKRSAVEMASLTHAVAIRSEKLDGFGSPDPTDRFLVATAIEESLVLVTADRTIRRYRAVETLW